MELSKRLQAVADLLDCHEKIADIGCDHGFVSIYLIESKKASWCLAMDVNKGPLERAREHVLEKRLSTYIETRLSDGAKEIQFLKDESGEDKLEVEAALIAGMGGKLMIQIIQDSLEKFQNMEEFVLQPQSEIAKVRQFVREIGYHIAKEDMILEDGKYYPMMKVVRGKVEADYVTDVPEGLKAGNSIGEIEAVFNDEELQIQLQMVFDEYGEYLLKEKHPVLLQFLCKEKKLYQGILNNLAQLDTEKTETRQKEIKEKLEYIHLGLEWFKDEM